VPVRQVLARLHPGSFDLAFIAFNELDLEVVERTERTPRFSLPGTTVTFIVVGT
jgi:hypothetical protein